MVAGSGADSLVKEELVKLRRENDSLNHAMRDFTRKISVLESDKTELETKVITHLTPILIGWDVTVQCCLIVHVFLYAIWYYSRVSGIKVKVVRSPCRISGLCQ